MSNVEHGKLEEGTPIERIIEHASALFSAGEYDQCLVLLESSIDGGAGGREAFMLSAKACVELCRQGNTSLAARRILPLMKFCAHHPDNTYVRSVIERVFRSELVEPDTRIILAALAAFTVTPLLQAMIADLRGGGSFRQSYEAIRCDNVDAFNEFLEKIFDDVASRGKQVLGLNAVPEHIIDSAPANYIKCCLTAIMAGEQAQAAISKEVLFFQDIVLHAIISLCDKHGDPSSDYLALHFAIQYGATAGDHQRGRDLAEVGLLAFTLRQEANRNHRIALAWLCWAEAWLRANQPFQAAQALIYAASVANSCPFSAEWAMRIPYIATRVFREVGIVPVARGFLVLRNEIILVGIKSPAVREYLQTESEVAALQLDLFESAGKIDVLPEILKKSLALLKKAPEKEKASIASAALNAARHLAEAGQVLDDETLRHVNDSISHLPPGIREAFSSAISGEISIEALRRLIVEVPDARYRHDLASAIRHLIPLAYRLIHASISTGDLVKYLISCSILSQPSLIASKEGKFYVGSGDDSWRNVPGETLTPEEKAKKYVSSVTEERGYTFKNLSEFDLRVFVGAIGGSEVIYVLALDASGRLSTACVSRHSTAAPLYVRKSQWNADRYRLWRQEYPYKYGSWTPSDDPFRPEEITSDEIQRSLLGLAVGIRSSYAPITIIPTAKLFGLPYNIMPDDVGESMILRQPLAVAPSIPWLLKSRKLGVSLRPTKAAWMGYPNGVDLNLDILRQKMEPELTRHGFVMDDGQVPVGLRGQGIAVIVLHGQLGTDGYFMSVSDRNINLSPEALSEYLEDTQCVVLFVCSGGASKSRRDESEAHSMVASLLENGARAVIASPWPLAIDVAEMWIAPFMNCIQSGGDLFSAAWAANRQIRQRYDHPSGWGAMHLYGDGQLGN